VLDRIHEEGRRKSPLEYAEIEAIQTKYRRLRGDPEPDNEFSEPDED